MFRAIKLTPGHAERPFIHFDTDKHIPPIYLQTRGGVKARWAIDEEVVLAQTQVGRNATNGDPLFTELPFEDLCDEVKSLIAAFNTKNAEAEAAQQAQEVPTVQEVLLTLKVNPGVDPVPSLCGLSTYLNCHGYGVQVTKLTQHPGTPNAKEIVGQTAIPTNLQQFVHAIFSRSN